MKKRILSVFVLTLCIVVKVVNADYTFGEPTNLGSTINSSAWDFGTSISPDGLFHYFSSNRPGGSGGHDLWVTTRATTDDDWGNPVNLGPTVNSSSWDSCPSISADGLSLYFESQRPGGSGDDDIWVTTRATTDDDWGIPVNLGPTVNSSAWDSCPDISADGLSLYFCSYRSGGSGRCDLWVVTRATVSDPWGQPENLGPTVNSWTWDYGPDTSADGLCLFFFSTRPGGVGPGGASDDDIWVTTRASTSAPWREPVNLGPSVNCSVRDFQPYISSDGCMLYFTSNRPGGVGSMDLWQVSIEPIVDFNGDGNIDTNDLLIMIDNWGTEDSTCDIGPMPWGDGIVDDADLEVLMSYWGQEIYDPTLIAHWKLDETEGVLAYDSAGLNDAFVIGEPVWQPEGGTVNGVIELDGIDDYISTPFILNSLTYQSFSVFVWIKGGGPGQVIISQDDDADWLLVDSSTGGLASNLFSGRGAAALVSDVVITDGNWHRIGLTWDGSHKVLYVDDQEVALDTAIGTGNSQDGFNIGASRALRSGAFFWGLIDDVRIYNRAIIP